MNIHRRQDTTKEQVHFFHSLNYVWKRDLASKRGKTNCKKVLVVNLTPAELTETQFIQTKEKYKECLYRIREKMCCSLHHHLIYVQSSEYTFMDIITYYLSIHVAWIDLEVNLN